MGEWFHYCAGAGRGLYIPHGEQCDRCGTGEIDIYNDAIERDAARWRFLRDRAPSEHFPLSNLIGHEGEALDDLVDGAIAAPGVAVTSQPQQSEGLRCTRSHPHENMSEECERLTVMAREQNAAARGALAPPADGGADGR